MFIFVIPRYVPWQTLKSSAIVEENHRGISGLVVSLQ